MFFSEPTTTLTDYVMAIQCVIQAAALHRLTEASRVLQEGLQAEPGRPDLAALQTRIAKDLAYAEESYEAANRMRRIEKGAVHALTAIERGLKACAHHPQFNK